jgi:hypothetical protein
MIKHFPKWLQLVQLSNRNSEITTYAFWDKVFSRFGALAKVLIDQGTKFHEEFQELCENAFIDHRTTSQQHHVADGLITHEWCRR